MRRATLPRIVIKFRKSKGLSPERIEKFEHFTADESLVGEQCLICMNDFEFGMEMVRLDCHVDHILCKVCVEKWFKNHKTCPTCREEFKKTFLIAEYILY